MIGILTDEQEAWAVARAFYRGWTDPGEECPYAKTAYMEAWFRGRDMAARHGRFVSLTLGSRP